MRKPNEATPFTKQLDVSNAKLTCLDSVLELQYLQTLNISYNQLLQINVASLVYLEELDVSHNAITSLERCDFPKSLTRLNLAYNDINRLDKLSQLPSLTHLNLQQNTLTSLNGVSVSCPSLCEIDASQNHISQVNDLQDLSKCPLLFKIVLTGNPLSSPSNDNWIEKLVYIVPQLQIVENQSNDSSASQTITVNSFIESCAKHGDDDQRRTKLTRFFKCRSDRTRTHHIDNVACVRWSGLAGVQRVLNDKNCVDQSVDPSTDLSVDLVRTDIQPFLAEPKFWTLMAEQGFTNQWIRLAKAIDASSLIAVQNGNHVEVNLADVQLGSVGLRAVAQALLNRSTRTAVTALAIRGADTSTSYTCPLGNHYGLVHLLNSVAVSNVSTISMQRCSIGIAECDLVAAHIELDGVSPVRHLDLSWNQIGRHQYLETVQIHQCPGLIKLLTARSFLRLLTLNLAHNGIDRQGASYIASWLLTCQAQTLILDGNPLDDQSIELISQALAHNSTVQTLSISGLAFASSRGGLSLSALASLTACLATQNDTLESINLANNRLLCDPSSSPDVSAGALIAQWICRDPRFRSVSCVLRSIDLSNTGLRSVDLLPISAVLSKNQTLQSLRFSIADTKSVSPAHATSFLRAVSASGLLSLNATGLLCDVSDQTVMHALNLVCSRHRTLVSLIIGPIIGACPASEWVGLPPRSKTLTNIELVGVLHSSSPSIDRILLETLQVASLDSVTLRGHTLAFETIRVLTSMFSGFSKITSISFVDCAFPSGNELEPMFDSMLANQELRHFTLQRTLLNNLHWRGFINVMQSRKSKWRSIRLSGCGLSYMDECSAQRLLSQPDLTELDLSDNLFSVEELVKLSDGITAHSPLQHLILSTGRAPFRFSDSSFDLSRRDWQTTVSSLISKCSHMQHLALPHINVQNTHQNDLLVGDVLQYLNMTLTDLLIRQPNSVPTLPFLTLPISLTFDHTRRCQLIKLLEICPSLQMCTDLTRSHRINWASKVASCEDEQSLSSVSARFAVNRLR